MIVQKLGYSEDEVKRYVKNDPNSFVGVLYQKLLDDQIEKQAQMDKYNQHIKTANGMTHSISNSSEHNISAKLPIQPSFVPSIGCLS